MKNEAKANADPKLKPKRKLKYMCEAIKLYGCHMPLLDPDCPGCIEAEIKRLCEKDN